MANKVDMLAIHFAEDSSSRKEEISRLYNYSGPQQSLDKYVARIKMTDILQTASFFIIGI
jgi:hypothetical protein